MSNEDRILLTKPLKPVAVFRSKRRIAVGVASLASLAIAGTALFIWEPWVDRSPFTARSYSPLGADMFVDTGDGSCRAEGVAAREKLLGEDKRVLATGSSQGGEILSSEYGDLAGHCFAYTEFTGVPAGEDAYFVVSGERLYTADGEELGPVETAEASLRESMSEAKKHWENFQEPAD
ncbi:hypothetical protein D1J63_14425 [Streptomyces sp. KPB2]|uniref:hypothetical protein n=1 Tax=Streptomyces TaxID=1883 RepID=UPI000F6EFC47|nr:MULTISPECIES: hypothetical protein [Streptomyces]WSU01813.1 hypothetical protein OG368_14880 [Streptomyces sp. NBC_01124]AZM76032.1 hypothetical protein D1J63_14425 [Streptomyces sp. KPB2]MBH5133405.1 hypothetical protein [Streptomyces sp. HB-N217]MDU0255733.1 hypothetical protein [Streptomyces sp. PU10]QKW61589.1 hypothetical protein HUT15_14220 [Streptomyces sp. NA03103]